MNLADHYELLHDEVLRPVAAKLEAYIKDILEDSDRIDAVSARAKSLERFLAKSQKTDSFGEPKYSDPLNQIQDQIGARINVLYLNDVPKVKGIIDGYFHAIEWEVKHPENDAEFGYFGEHYVLRMPDEAIPQGLEERTPKFFELQIKTLFQHAWSECHHDIGYKAPRELTSHERRQMAFSAAQSWGADQIFRELSGALLPSAQNDAE